MNSGNSSKATYSKLSATVVQVDGDAVWIAASDGRRWGVSRADLPEHLAREGQPISLLHDERGFVRDVEGRAKEEVSPALQARITAARGWIEGPGPID